MNVLSILSDKGVIKPDDIAAITKEAQDTQMTVPAVLEKRGISARVVNVHTIKPIDEKTIIEAAKDCGAIVTAEEHQLFGGFGSAVCEVLAQKLPVPVEMVGVNDTFGESGNAMDLMKTYHLKDADIITAVEKVLKRKK